jgi:hypothetical protein
MIDSDSDWDRDLRLTHLEKRVFELERLDDRRKDFAINTVKVAFWVVLAVISATMILVVSYKGCP